MFAAPTLKPSYLDLGGPPASGLLGQDPFVTEDIGYGDPAIYATLQKMKEVIRLSAGNPLVRHWAESILDEAGVQARDKQGEASAIHKWVKAHILYTRDPLGWEYLQTPPVLLQKVAQYGTARGDCDDMTTLGLSLLRSIGFPSKLKVASYNSKKKYSHVYGLVNIAGTWTAFDCVKQEFVLGSEAPNPTRWSELEV